MRHNLKIQRVRDDSSPTGFIYTVFLEEMCGMGATLLKALQNFDFKYSHPDAR